MNYYNDNDPKAAAWLRYRQSLSKLMRSVTNERSDFNW